MAQNNVTINHTITKKTAYSNLHYLTSVTVKFEETQSKTHLHFMTWTLPNHFNANFSTATHSSLQSRLGTQHNLFSQVMKDCLQGCQFSSLHIYALRCTWTEQYHNVSSINALRVSWGKLILHRITWWLQQKTVLVKIKMFLLYYAFLKTFQSTTY